MRRKRLMTAALCTVLVMASPAFDSAFGNTSIITAADIQQDEAAQAEGEHVLKEEGSPKDGSQEGRSSDADVSPTAENGQGEAPPEQTDPPATEPPQTNPPATEPPQTNPPATEPPQTSAPATEPPQTNPPATEPPQTSAPATEPPQTGTPATELPGEPVTEPSQSELPGETQTTEPSSEHMTEPSSEHMTEPSTTPSTEMPGTETLPSDPAQSETIPTETAATESETMSETESESESEEESESETSEYGSNEELIAHQNIVIPPDIKLEFRFTKVDGRVAVVRNDEGACVYEEKAETARAVGELAYYGLCYILEDKGDGWYYVESHNVRGFVKAGDVVTDDVAQRIVTVKGEEELPTARLLVARNENKAFCHTYTTVQEVIAEKEYALAAEDTVEIREQKKEDSRVTGTLEKGALCYILADEKQDWVFVESGDARGFVEKDKLTTGRKASRQVEKTGENNMTLASVQVEPEDNKSCYYTLTSVREASQAARTREEIVNFAVQFLGNPYVWGGTSLTNGADCSGFVQSVYAHFGYSLPRVACDQAGYGMQIPVDHAEPGDLIFYARNGYVYHVSMYIGNGQVVHAAGRRVGIITSGIAGNAVWATRIITD